MASLKLEHLQVNLHSSFRFLDYNQFHLGGTFDKTFYVSTTSKLIWGDVQANCRSHGMDFVSLDTLDEANSFLKTFSSTPGADDEWYWIGASTSRAGTTDNFVWQNSGMRVNYNLPFAKGEPNNGGSGNENCLTAGRKSYNIANFLLNDLHCSSTVNRFICQYACSCIITTTSSTSTTTSSKILLSNACV